MALVAGTAQNIVQYVYRSTFVRFLSRLYLFGPNLKGFGFWEGKEAQDICAELTGVSSNFWSNNISKCYERIHKHFNGYVILFESIVVFVVLLRILWSCRCPR